MNGQKNAESASIAWGNDFYKTPRWRALRQRALLLYGKECCKCGNPNLEEPPEVDHIKPRSIYPKLALSMTNLQILCQKCNSAKSNVNEHDYRTQEQKILAESYASNPKSLKSLLKHKMIVEKVGREEADRRKKQKQLDKKNNPRKRSSKKELRAEIKLQVEFLNEVRIAKQNGHIHLVLAEYERMVGQDIVDRLIKRCNITHWI